MTNEKPKIFISHASQEQDVVQHLENKLKAAGVDVWVDYSNIAGGDQISAQVNEALERCNTMLLLWSASARASEWVTKEWGAANHRHKKIIPCLLDDTELPALLSNVAYIDFRDLDQGITNLCLALGLQGRPVSNAMEPKTDDHSSAEVAVKVDKMEIELRINRNFDSYSKKDQDSLLSAVQALLKTNSDIRIVNMRRGSILLSLELPPEQAKRLLWAVKAGQLASYDVVDAEIKDFGDTLGRIPKTPDNLLDAAWIEGRLDVLRFYLRKKWGLTHEDLEEVAQEALLTALKSYKNYDQMRDTEPSTYLLGIANNVAQAYYRRRGRSPKRDRTFEFAESIGIIFRDETEASDGARILKEKMKLLPKKYVDILDLVYYKGYKVGEAAKALEMPPDKVYRCKSDALKRLRKLCGKEPAMRALFVSKDK